MCETKGDKGCTEPQCESGYENELDCVNRSGVQYSTILKAWLYYVCHCHIDVLHHYIGYNWYYIG